jgi:hypothetical protein
MRATTAKDDLQELLDLIRRQLKIHDDLADNWKSLGEVLIDTVKKLETKL